MENILFCTVLLEITISARILENEQFLYIPITSKIYQTLGFVRFVSDFWENFLDIKIFMNFIISKIKFIPLISKMVKECLRRMSEDVAKHGRLTGVVQCPT